MEEGQGIIMVVGVIFVGQRIRNNGVYGGKPQMLAERTLMLELNKIYTGDCLEIMRGMPDKCVDLVLTDPPYGIDMNKPFGSYSSPQVFDGDWDKKIPTKRYFDEIFRVSKNQVIFGGNYFTEYLKPTSAWLFWDKNNGESTFADGELVWTSFDFALRKIRVNWTGSASLKEDTHGKIHPTQKPIGIIGACINRFLKENDIIL